MTVSPVAFVFRARQLKGLSLLLVSIYSSFLLLWSGCGYRSCLVSCSLSLLSLLLFLLLLIIVAVIVRGGDAGGPDGGGREEDEGFVLHLFAKRKRKRMQDEDDSICSLAWRLAARDGRLLFSLAPTLDRSGLSW
jgi:hypothetical protein